MNNDQEITQANTVRSRRSCRWINVKQKKNSGVLSLRGITGFHGCSRLSLLASIGPLDWGFSSPAPIYSFIVYSLYAVASLFWNILKQKKKRTQQKVRKKSEWEKSMEENKAAAKAMSRFKRVCVFCGSSTGKRNCYRDAALDLGQELVSFNFIFFSR